MTTFEQLGVPPVIVRALAGMRYERPTEVQAAALPDVLHGRDVLLEAETGSGKTAAFGIQAVVVGSKERGLGVLVLVPTRELARQVSEEIREIGTGSPFRCVAVTGGVNAEAEERTLAGDVRCVVATPGRLLALLEARKVRLDHVKLVVLDEADRMLDMGFKADVENVLKAATARTQTLMVSATIPAEVAALAQRHMAKVKEVRISRAAPAQLEHFRLNVMADEKQQALIALLRKENPARAIVFVHTRDRARQFTKLLKQAGIPADMLQGEMTHEQRRHVFDLFSRGISKVLVATDIAARGLDVPEMELVVNVDVPEEPEAYSHRAGRAARLGRAGRVVTMVRPDEKDDRLQLERESGREWTPYRLEFSEADLPQAHVEARNAKAAAKAARERKSAAKREARFEKRGETRGRPARAPPPDDLPPSRRRRER